MTTPEMAPVVLTLTVHVRTPAAARETLRDLTEVLAADETVIEYTAAIRKPVDTGGLSYAHLAADLTARLTADEIERRAATGPSLAAIVQATATGTPCPCGPCAAARVF